MLVDDRTIVEMRETDGVLPGASPHESGSWLMHLHIDLLVHPTLLNGLVSGIKYCRTSKLLPGVSLPHVHLHSKPGLSNFINSFVWKRDQRNCFCQVFLALGKAHKSLVIWRPQEVPTQPHSCLVMDKGLEAENEVAVTLSSLNDRL